MEFYWPGTSHDSALYRVDVTCGTERMTRISSEPSFGVSGIQEGERLEIRVWAVADGKSLFGKPKEVKSWKCFHAELALPGGLEAPEVTGALEDGAASLRWTGEGDVYEVFRDYGAFSVFAGEAREREIALPLGGGGYGPAAVHRPVGLEKAGVCPLRPRRFPGGIQGRGPSQRREADPYIPGDRPPPVRPGVGGGSVPPL